VSERTLIRALEERDLCALVQLCREHAEFERAPWEPRERSQALASLFLDAPRARCWVIECEARLVGFASAASELSTWDAAFFVHLDCIFLQPAHRGQGLGRELMERVCAWAQELGAINIQWQTPVWNQEAIGFYRKFGARSTEKQRFQLGREAYQALQMNPPGK